MTQYFILICGSYIPSAGLLGNYAGGLLGASAIKQLQTRDYSDNHSGEEYAYEHEEGHEGQGGHLDDEQFTGKHELTEDIQDNKDHSDFFVEHKAESEESFHGDHLPDIPESHYDHEDEKDSDYEPNESKMFHHPALDFNSEEYVKKIYHGKGGYSYSTLYENL